MGTPLDQVGEPATHRVLLKIKTLSHSITWNTKRLRDEKIELYKNVYLYFELLGSRKGMSNTEVAAKLVDDVGGTRDRWLSYRRWGQFLREMPGNHDKVRPSALSQVVSAGLSKKDHRFFVNALASGATQSQIRAMLIERGYQKAAFQGLPSKPKDLRRVFKKWGDFRPVLNGLLERMSNLTDKPELQMKLVIYVDGKRVADAAYERFIEIPEEGAA